jgi:lipoprotein-anchoring transpeptidase ErfK/SrfK
LFIFIAIFVCLVTPIFAGGIFYISIQQSQNLLPNIQTNDIPIGGLPVNEASLLVHQAGNLSHSVEISNQFVSKVIPITELGISIDPVKTIDAAYRLGREGSLFTRVRTILLAYTRGITLEAIIVFDITQAQSQLEALAPFFTQPPVEATFYLEEDRINALPGSIGYTPNIEESLVLIRGNPELIFYSNRFTVPLKPILPVSVDLAEYLGEARRLVETPVELIFYDPVLDQWITQTLPKEILLDWLVLEDTGSGGQLQVDEKLVIEYLEQMNRNLLPEQFINVADAAPLVIDTLKNQSHPVIFIDHRTTTYNVQPGDTLLRIGWKLGIPYWLIVNANPAIDPDQIAPGTDITIPSRDALLPLPVVLHKRIIISIQEQRLWVYEYGKQIQKFVISTGIDRSPTQPGIFQVQSHIRSAYASIWDLTMPNFLGIYEAWPGFMNGIHGLPTLSNGRILWANVLGKPASYGCIILNLNAADWLYQWAEDGVVVEIRP